MVADVRGAKKSGCECEAGLDAAQERRGGQDARGLGGRLSGKLEAWRKDD